MPFGYTLVAPFETSSSVILEFGENLSEKIIFVDSIENRNYRARIQLETSITVMMEGPHLDMLDWKHCTTDWLDLKRFKSDRFTIPNLDEIDTDCFPEVSRKELRAAVMEYGGEYWAKLISDDIRKEELPIAVSLSSVRLKIEARENGKWELITIINVVIPMGS